MKQADLLSSLVKSIELEILTTEESALIGGAADSGSTGNNCKCGTAMNPMSRQKCRRRS